jgi:hypothetical protein
MVSVRCSVTDISRFQELSAVGCLGSSQFFTPSQSQNVKAVKPIAICRLVMPSYRKDLGHHSLPWQSVVSEPKGTLLVRLRSTTLREFWCLSFLFRTWVPLRFFVLVATLPLLGRRAVDLWNLVWASASLYVDAPPLYAELCGAHLQSFSGLEELNSGSFCMVWPFVTWCLRWCWSSSSFRIATRACAALCALGAGLHVARVAQQVYVPSGRIDVFWAWHRLVFYFEEKELKDTCAPPMSQ